MVKSLNSPPIDAVITWVDGTDPQHKQKLAGYLSSLGKHIPPSANPTRFFSAGELEYCVASILKFAPWIGTIYIVTDQQIPDFVRQFADGNLEARVRIVDHMEIFCGFEEALPTFNSSSILPMLHRIPGLSERFLFFNDDFMLIQPVNPEDFFQGDCVVLRGLWRPMSERLWYKRLHDLYKKIRGAGKPKSMARPGYLRRQEMSARLLGYTREYFQVPHNPHAWRVSSFKRFFDGNPEVLVKQIAHRLRSADQFLTESLAAHIELRSGTVVIDRKLKTMQIKPSSQFFWEMRLLFKIMEMNNRYAFLCIQSLERGELAKQQYILDWLDQRIGKPQDVFAACC